MKSNVTRCPQLPAEEIKRINAHIPDSENKCLDGTPVKRTQVQLAHINYFRRQYGLPSVSE
jgi:hypothetical protein